MGLDLVEFVMEVENTLDIRIPNKDAERLETPRELIDYLSERLHATNHNDTICFTQRAFYRARRAAALRFGRPRHTMRPQTLLADVLGSRQSQWKSLGKDLGSRHWPRLRSDHWLASSFGGISTFGDLAHHLATHDVATMRNPGTAWTRQQIEAVVVNLIEAELGADMTKYTLDSQFVRDMGVD